MRDIIKKYSSFVGSNVQLNGQTSGLSADTILLFAFYIDFPNDSSLERILFLKCCSGTSEIHGRCACETLIQDCKRLTEHVWVSDLTCRTLADLKPVWLMDPKEVDSDTHEDFYRHVSGAFDKPRFVHHFRYPFFLITRQPG